MKKQKYTANQKEVMQAHMMAYARHLAAGTMTKEQVKIGIAESKRDVLGVKNGK